MYPTKHSHVTNLRNQIYRLVITRIKLNCSGGIGDKSNQVVVAFVEQFRTNNVARLDKYYSADNVLQYALSNQMLAVSFEKEVLTILS